MFFLRKRLLTLAALFQSWRAMAHQTFAFVAKEELEHFSMQMTITCMYMNK